MYLSVRAYIVSYNDMCRCLATVSTFSVHVEGTYGVQDGLAVSAWQHLQRLQGLLSHIHALDGLQLYTRTHRGADGDHTWDKVISLGLHAIGNFIVSIKNLITPVNRNLPIYRNVYLRICNKCPVLCMSTLHWWLWKQYVVNFLTGYICIYFE